MRISSGKIKLVVADEPTSAMDPQGEFELFQALRKVREGTSMIFITHRFGHLTKHADLILYGFALNLSVFTVFTTKKFLLQMLERWRVG